MSPAPDELIAQANALRERGDAPLKLAHTIRHMALLKEKTGLDATAIRREVRVLHDQAGVAAGVAEVRARLSEPPQ